jgi:hypothetical protein
MRIYTIGKVGLSRAGNRSHGLIASPIVFAELPAGDKTKHVIHVFFRLFVICIMAAIGEHREFRVRQIAVESHALLDLEQVASVGIQNQHRAGNVRQHGSYVEVIFSVSPAESPELLEHSFGSLAVPSFEFGFHVGIKILISLAELRGVEFIHRRRAVAQGARYRNVFDSLGVLCGIIQSDYASFALTDEVKSRHAEPIPEGFQFRDAFGPVSIADIEFLECRKISF